MIVHHVHIKLVAVGVEVLLNVFLVLIMLLNIEDHVKWVDLHGFIYNAQVLIISTIFTLLLHSITHALLLIILLFTDSNENPSDAPTMSQGITSYHLYHLIS